MNTLTKNRIIEKGDEYLDGDKWKLVPKDDIGLQIMFSKYSEVRRPSEKPVTTSNGTEQQGSQTVRQESAKLPIAGSIPAPASTTGDASYLPTVVSAKAHTKLPRLTPDFAGEFSKAMTEAGAVGFNHKEDPVPASPTPATVKVLPSKAVEITWPLPDELDTKWIGRNGTFKSRALNLHVREELMGAIIQIVPVGKRGTAKNALIEFPVSAIPKVVEWLTEKYMVGTPK